MPTPSIVLTTLNPTTVATTAVPTETPPAIAPLTAAPAFGRDRGDDGRDDLEPVPVPTGTGTLLSATAVPEFSRFAQALLQGGIYETLNGTGT